MLRLPDCRWSSSQASWRTCSVRLRTRRASAAPWRPQSAAASRCGHLSQCKDWHQLGTPQLTLTPHQQPQGHTAQREAGGLLLLPLASRLPYGGCTCAVSAALGGHRPQPQTGGAACLCPCWCVHIGAGSQSVRQSSAMTSSTMEATKAAARCSWVAPLTLDIKPA